MLIASSFVIREFCDELVEDGELAGLVVVERVGAGEGCLVAVEG